MSGGVAPAISGRALFTTRHDAAIRYALDVQTYIPKPFDVDELVHGVASLVE